MFTHFYDMTRTDLTAAVYRASYRHILVSAAPIPQPDGTIRLAVSGPALASLQHYEHVASEHKGDEHAYRVSGAKVALAELRSGKHVLQAGVGQLTYAMSAAGGGL